MIFQLVSRPTVICLACLFGCVISRAQTGPGGVGNTAGTSSLKMWYRVDNGVTTAGTSVNSWTNSAGVSALDISETGTNRPTLVASGPNGYGEVSFNGSNKLTTAAGVLTSSNFVTNQASSFVVSRADNTTQQSCVYTTDPLEVPRFSTHIPWSATVYFDIGDCCADRIQTGFTNAELTNYASWTYEANTSAGKQLYRNGTQSQTVAAATLTYTPANNPTHRFNIGGFTSGTEGFAGDITEVIIFTTKVNTAQRYIIQNYLAAKYGLALPAAIDLYTRDNNGNGNYDHDVAGIGRFNNANQQTDSRGTGIVRVLNASDLEDGDYYFWGHDNGALSAQTTNVPTGVQGRFTRVWRGQEVGSLDDFDIEFDLANLGSVTASQLRLLVDTDNDGSFSDETVVGGGVISGAAQQGTSTSYRFSNVTALITGGSNTRRFTLGTTNISQTPLPITLMKFDAEVDNNNDVKLMWTTAQEINNEYFTIERSSNGLDWEEILKIPGAGDSKTARSYSEYDRNPLWGKSYYRLKQTDFDGSSTYFNVRSVIVNRSFRDVVVHPVPANDVLLIKYPSSEKIVFKLADQFGREYAITPEIDQDGASIPVSTIPPGIYFLYITNGREESHKKVIIE